MTQVSSYPISKEVADRIFELFLKSLIAIKTNDQADQFISDLLTPTEKIMLSKRLAIAFLLEKGYDYKEIQQLLKVSSATISSVNIVRIHGSRGYIKLLQQIMKEEVLSKLLEDAVIKTLSVPASLGKGKGVWSYVKMEVELQKKNRKGF